MSPLANLPVAAVQGGGARRDDAPFDALGIRLGTFTLFPVLTQSIGVTSNADASCDGSSTVFSQTEARLTGQSDWTLHELRGEIGGSYQTYFSGDTEDLSAFNASLQLRLDHSFNITSRFGASYDLTTESAESDNLSVPPPLFVTEDPNLHQLSGFVDVEKQAGQLSDLLRGTITQSIYENTALSDGSTLSQSARTNTLYEIEGRVGYEVSAKFQPFVEASLGSRQHQRTIDRNGNQRNSIIYALCGGLVFDQGDKLSGELLLGYSSEQFDDAAINDLNGFTVDASINWSPQRLATITTTAQTEFTGSTNANEAGSVTYALSLGVAHDLRPNLSLNARMLVSLRDYDGSGRQDEVFTGADWGRMASQPQCGGDCHIGTRNLGILRHIIFIRSHDRTIGSAPATVGVPFRNEVRSFPEQRWLEFVPFLTSPARASCCPRLIAEVAGYRAIHSGAAWSPVSRLIGNGGFAAPPRPDH